MPIKESASQSPNQRQEEIHFAIGTSTLGSILAAKSQIGLLAIFLGHSEHELQRELQKRFPGALLVEGSEPVKADLDQVIDYIEGRALQLDVLLDKRGTDFQRRVWEALLEIPRGSTMSYAAIAQKIGAPKASRAVALACAANPLAIVIPCHRVIKSDGSLSGYEWGIERKKALLRQELEAPPLKGVVVVDEEGFKI
ncbi:MAG: putative methylated-DNA--protein-cysteine methyltransferase [Chlamydiales bacterium]|jgi:AraC family transcriptional regulator of adaptative response/methylated-DNA-[protein]-cysteine methyltransferase|nr:putative methylated-DNA--protein-cysteine methyltransferase [Chlamydiales bacterium]